MRKLLFGLLISLSILSLMIAGSAVDNPAGTVNQVILFGLLGIAMMLLAVFIQPKED